MTRDYLTQCLKATPEERLAWLEEINQFTQKAVPFEKRRLWDKFRRGEI